MQFSAVSQLCFLPIILMPAGVIRFFFFFNSQVFAVVTLRHLYALPRWHWQLPTSSFYQVLIGRAVVMKHSTRHNVLNACRSATATLTSAQAVWFHATFTHSLGNSDTCLWLCFQSLSAGVWDSLLASCSHYLVNRLWKVWNSAAQLISQSTQKTTTPKPQPCPSHIALCSHYSGCH